MTDERNSLNPEDEENYLVSLLTPLTTTVLRDEALKTVAPDDFWSGHHGELWRAARVLREADKPITRRSLITATEVGTAAIERILERVSGHVPPTAQFPAAVAEVIRCGKVRRILTALDRSRQAAVSAGDPSEALAKAIDALGKLDDAAGPTGPRAYGDLLEQWEDAQTRREDYMIVPTEWPDLNDLLAGGLHAGRLYLVGARPGEGKSIVGHNIAHHAALYDHPTLVFSVEMGDLEVTGRMVSAGAEVHMDRISRRALQPDDWSKFRTYKAQHESIPLFIDDRPGLTLSHIVSTCRSQKRRTGLSVVVVDYMQLVKSDRTNASREQQVGHISQSLKELSRELDCAVVVPCQLNRRSVDRERPSLADLRESGSLEQDADTVLLMARLTFPVGSEQAGKPTGVLAIEVAKNRHGKRGSIDLQFQGEHSRIAS
jgi:replicative DNA helicase